MKTIVKTINLTRGNFQLFKGLVAGTPQENALRNKGAEEIWQLFKATFLRAQELSVLICKKSGKEGRMLECLSKVLLVKLKHKREMHTQWKQGHTSWE